MPDDFGQMRVRAVLCRFAELSDHGLVIVGAGTNRVLLPPESEKFEAALAVLVHVPWTETNTEHRLLIELVHEGPDGGTTRVPINLGSQDWLPGDHEDRGKIHLNVNLGRPKELVHGEESVQPFAIPIRRRLPGPGSYYFSFRFSDQDQEAERISFRALSIQIIGMTMQ